MHLCLTESYILAHTMNFIISIGLLTLLAIDRYFVLVKNAWRNVRTKQRPPSFAHFYVAIVWTLGLLLAMPNIIATEYKIDESNYAVCTENWQGLLQSSSDEQTNITKDDLCNNPTFIQDAPEMGNLSVFDFEDEFNMESEGSSLPFEAGYFIQL